MRSKMVVAVFSLFAMGFGIKDISARVKTNDLKIPNAQRPVNENFGEIRIMYKFHVKFIDVADDKWKTNPIAQHYLEEIRKQITRVETYDSKIHSGLFLNGNEKYALLAISKKERDKWFNENREVFGDRKSNENYLDPALDKLSAALARRLPKYFPHRNNFAYHNPTDEKLMLTLLKKRLTIKKLHLIGQFHKNWIIKTNQYGIPVERYKEGFIWVQNAADDHPYCHLYQVDTIQKYSGGGTYGSTFAFYVGDKLFAC